jgi:hypothetical protein
VTRRLNPQPTFIALAILVNLVASGMAHAVTDSSRHRLVAFGAAVDMILTVTGLYYWLVVRPGLRSKASLIFIAVMGLLRASYAVPEVIPGKALIMAGAEAALLGAIVLGWRRARTLKAAQPDGDPAERIREILAGIVPFSTAERALGGELSVLYYGFAWRARPHVSAGARPFTLHERGAWNDLFLFVGLASLLEVLPVHLIVSRFSLTAAWILTALSLYGALWAIALGRSFRLRPTLVGPEEIVVRFGLLFSLRIPLSAIRSITRSPIANAMPVPRRTPPTLFLEFARPLEVRKMFGFTRQITAIGISADDDHALERAIRERL